MPNNAQKLRVKNFFSKIGAGVERPSLLTRPDRTVRYQRQHPRQIAGWKNSVRVNPQNFGDADEGTTPQLDKFVPESIKLLKNMVFFPGPLCLNAPNCRCGKP